MSSTGIVFDIDRFATHDGPGIRTTIFLKGCPLSCLWCHSPESQSMRAEILFRPERCAACGRCEQVCPRGAIRVIEKNVGLEGRQADEKTGGPAGDRPGEETGDRAGEEAGGRTANRGAVLDYTRCDSCGICCETCYAGALETAGRQMSVEAVVEKVSRDAPYFRTSGGGVTVSGGEPLAQAEFTYELLSAFKKRDIHTAVETTGYGPWSSLLRLAEVTDLFLYDLKAVDDEIHRRYTGVSNSRIIENLTRLCVEGAVVQVRVPCIPGVNDSPGQIRKLAETAADAGAGSITLLPYNNAASAKYAWIGRPYKLDGVRRREAEYMENLAAICREYDLDTQIVG